MASQPHKKLCSDLSVVRSSLGSSWSLLSQAASQDTTTHMVQGTKRVNTCR